MKESLTDYATELSGDSIEILEDIIENKFLKFKKFFDFVRPYTDDIKKLEYTFCEKDLLSVEVTFKKKVKVGDKKDLIASWKKAGYEVSYELGDKKMSVDIRYKE